MRNKYSELNDVEIEHLIAEKRNGRVIDRINRDVFVSKICSRYEDAFNLMIDNKISLISHTKNHQGVVVYSALSDFIECTYHIDNENPCRAIAECYLLMKDAEKDNE